MVEALLVEFGEAVTVEALPEFDGGLCVVENADGVAGATVIFEEPPAGRHRKSPRTSEIGGYSVGSPPVRHTGQRSVRGGSRSTIVTPQSSQVYDSPRIQHAPLCENNRPKARGAFGTVFISKYTGISKSAIPAISAVRDDSTA
jgi:hypothetical protein